MFYLSAKLDEVRQILEALGHHYEAARCRRTRLFADEAELSRVEQGRTEQPEEDEARDDPRSNKSLAWPLCHHRLLKTSADVAYRSRTGIWRCKDAERHLKA